MFVFRGSIDLHCHFSCVQGEDIRDIKNCKWVAGVSKKDFIVLFDTRFFEILAGDIINNGDTPDCFPVCKGHIVTDRFDISFCHEPFQRAEKAVCEIDNFCSHLQTDVKCFYLCRLHFFDSLERCVFCHYPLNNFPAAMTDHFHNLSSLFSY